MPEIYFVILFFILNGLISPDFGDFSYYYMLNVCHITKMQYSLLGIIGQVTSIFGTMYYESHMKDIEVRTLLYYSTCLSIVSGIFSCAFAMRWNLQLHISDMVFILLTDTVFGVIS